MLEKIILTFILATPIQYFGLSLMEWFHTGHMFIDFWSGLIYLLCIVGIVAIWWPGLFLKLLPKTLVQTDKSRPSPLWIQRTKRVVTIITKIVSTLFWGALAVGATGMIGFFGQGHALWGFCGIAFLIIFLCCILQIWAPGMISKQISRLQKPFSAPALSLIKKIAKTLVFVVPILPVLFIVCMMNESGNYMMIVLGGIACVYFLISIWFDGLISSLPKFIRTILQVLSFIGWGYCICMFVFGMLFVSALPKECPGCINIRPLIAENGEYFDLNRGTVLDKTKDGAVWLDCSCGKVFSFENNREYALSQIQKMEDYWLALPDCSEYTLYDYAQQTNFDLTGACYLHKEDLREDEDITVIYNLKTNRLLYLFYSS